MNIRFLEAEVSVEGAGDLLGGATRGTEQEVRFLEVLKPNSGPDRIAYQNCLQSGESNANKDIHLGSELEFSLQK